MDAFGSRKAILEEMPTILSDIQKKTSRANNGEVSLFDAIDSREPQKYDSDEFFGRPDFSNHEKLIKEKDYLGLFVSDHPLKHVQNIEEHARDMVVDFLVMDDPDSDTAEEVLKTDIVLGEKQSHQVQLAGMFSSLAHVTTRSGKKMARGTFEDPSGQIPFLVFPMTYEKVKDDLISEIEINGEKRPFFVIVEGEISRDDDETILIINGLRKLPEATNKIQSLNIGLDLGIDQELINELKKLLSRYKGYSPVFVTMGDKKIRLGDEYRVVINKDSKDSIEQLVGQGAVWES